MKKRLLLAGAATIALSGGAFAADLPTRVEAPAPFIAPPVFTWTGFYAGVNAGVGFNAGDDRDSTVVTGAPIAGLAGGTVIYYGDNAEDAAFTGGGFIGYNYQFVNNFVLGAEADIQFVGLGDDDTVAATSISPAPAVAFQPLRRGVTGVDWFGTVRLRAGYALDRTLVYATGGLAYGGGDAARFETAAGDRVLFEDDDIGFGWTLGAGVEYAWTDNLIVGLEGLYVSLDRDLDVNGVAGFVGATPVPAASESSDDNVEFGVVRARLSYKF